LPDLVRHWSTDDGRATILHTAQAVRIGTVPAWPQRSSSIVELVVGAVSILHAVVLGVVQGVAEYLPISSSGHLIFVPWLLGWNDFAGDESLMKAFDVALHLGTLVGAVAYFRSDIRRLARAATVGPRKDGRLAGSSSCRPCRQRSAVRCWPTPSRRTLIRCGWWR
jgi:hypothetical protein